VRHADLRSAGRDLALALAPYACPPDAGVVLGIVRGGVPAALEVSLALQLPLDLICMSAVLQRATGAAARAVRVAGTPVLEEELTAPAAGSLEAKFVDEALQRLEARESLCRGERAPFAVAGRTVFVIDNGMRTGGTMRAAVRAVRQLGAARVIAAVPVAAPPACATVEEIADFLVCLATPEPFGHVGMFYRRFEVPRETDVRDLLSPK
jgi:putative phosphoribosyl transferase